MIFKAIGLDVFYEEQPSKIERRIHYLADNDYAVIYITEKAATQVQEAIAMYATATFPAIIPIPLSSTSLGIGMKQLKANVEKAVGADILFKEG
jgi:V/A-type H+-transporting ATPase subunit F